MYSARILWPRMVSLSYKIYPQKDKQVKPPYPVVQVKINKVLRLVRYIASEIASYDNMPVMGM